MFADDRLPPHSIEAEQGVLGCMMLDPTECIALAVERLRSGEMAFYYLRHQTIYAAMAGMFSEGQAVDLITVRQRLKDKGQLDAIGGAAYLNSLVDATPSAANLPFYADIIIEKEMLRKMVRTCSEVVARIYEEENGGEVEQLLDDVEKQVLAIRGSEVRGEASMKDYVMAVTNKMQEDLDGNALRGLSTGFRTLDQWTRGLKRQNFIVIAARPSVGKSAIAMQIASRVALEDRLPVAVFSLEMSGEEITERGITQRARFVRAGKMTENQVRAIISAGTEFARAPMFILDEGGVTIGQIQARARRMHQRHTLALIVVDYIQLVRGTGRKENRAVEIGEVSRGLKALAKELDVPIIALAQLNRDCERQERPPRLSDLRESGSIEADADIVLLLHTKQDNGETREVEMKVEKNRGSRRGVIDFVFSGPLTEFREMDRICEADVPRHHSDRD